MKHYQTQYEKRIQRQLEAEDALIERAKFKPNERTIFKGHRFTLKYAEVRDGKLAYHAIQEKTNQPFCLFESELLPDQI